MFNINDFRAGMYQGQGFQKLNRYRIRFNIPRGFIGKTLRASGVPILEAMRYLEFYATSTDLPGVSLVTRPITRYGYGNLEKKPVGTIFNDFWCVFNNNGKSTNLEFFQDWISLVYSYDFSQGITTPLLWELSFKGDYAIDATITLLNDAGAETQAWTMREFYPISIPETKMSMDPQPTVMQIQVMFTYIDYFKIPVNQAR